MSIKKTTAAVGFLVDAGGEVGYGHAIRAIRLASALDSEFRPVFFPLSPECGRFLDGRNLPVRTDEAYPPVMVSDVRDAHPVIDALASRGCRHISIRDLGLGQSDSDVAIDGSITTVRPYPAAPRAKTFIGPRYMVIEPRTIVRDPRKREVLVSLGGGSSAAYTFALAEALAGTGFSVYATRGFERRRENRPHPPAVRWVDSESGIRDAMARCSLAITTSGVSLYEMLAAGVPAVALGVDEYQLRTARAFEERGAVRSVGLLEAADPKEVAEYANELAQDKALMVRLSEQGRRLVDGKGLFRVSQIVRSELCPTA